MADKFIYNLSYDWLPAGDVHDVTCCVCNGLHEQKTKLRFRLNRKIFEIRHCEADDLMYLFPQFGKKYCEKLYNHPSYFAGTDDMYGLDLNDDKSKRIAKMRASEIYKYAPRAKSILEIGSGYGHLLMELKNRGFKKIKGLEFSKQAVETSLNKGLDVIYADINSDCRNKIKESFDVIAAYSIFEHLDNPAQFLNIVKNFLNPSGVIIVRVPDINSIEGPKVSLLDHFWSFTRKSIIAMLQNSSFKIIDIFESGVFHGKQYNIDMTNMTIVASL